MKKYLIAMFAVATISLAGCGGGMSHDQMMKMMDEKMADQMMMMEKMRAHIGELDSTVATNAAMAENAQEMAANAMTKASMMSESMKKSDDHMMHQKKMMK